jgi:ABC-type lipoprotein export system ATPase subunit
MTRRPDDRTTGRPDYSPRLIATGLSKAFPALQVLSGCDLSVAAAEVVAVRGRSGTGKSTLLHCLGLLDRLDGGTIVLDGHDLTARTLAGRAEARARMIGFVFQAFHLLPDFDVSENILLAARTAGLDLGAARKRVDVLLDLVGLANRRRQDVRTLSGGERQRVALCRALLPKPGLLLADEPTGNLDPATAAVVLDQILGLARDGGAAVVLVTHDDGVAQRADRRLTLDAGKLLDSP